MGDQKTAHTHPTSTLTGPSFVRTFHMSEEDGTADCSHMIFGAYWSPEFPVIAPQNAGLERESYPSLGHNSWSEAAFSNATESGNVSAATITLRWSYSCLGHMSWPERAFPNEFKNSILRWSYFCLRLVVTRGSIHQRIPISNVLTVISTMCWSYSCLGHILWSEVAFPNPLTI